MSDQINVLETRQIMHRGVAYDAVFFEDANQPFQISFTIMHKGKRVPLRIPGVGFAIVQFGVSKEVQQDDEAVGAGSPINALYDEAARILRATIDG